MVEASVSDDVRPDGAQDAIKGFWERFLEQFAELISGRRAFEPSPLDQRFIGWLEGALEDPIAHTEDALASLSRTDSKLNDRLNLWMLSQGWEPSSQPEQRKQNLARASRLSCYILLTRLVFLPGNATTVQADATALSWERIYARSTPGGPGRQIRRSCSILPRLRDRFRAGRERSRLHHSVHADHSAQRLGSPDSAHLKSSTSPAWTSTCRRAALPACLFYSKPLLRSKSLTVLTPSFCTWETTIKAGGVDRPEH